MRDYALDLWQRALRALSTADANLQNGDSDAAASRAYYAAFYAVSAILALSDRTFTKHSAVEAAVHRDLVRTGRLPESCGADYRSLKEMRETGDYGGLEHVSREQADQAVRASGRIVEAVSELAPELRGAEG